MKHSLCSAGRAKPLACLARTPLCLPTKMQAYDYKPGPSTYCHQKFQLKTLQTDETFSSTGRAGAARLLGLSGFMRPLILILKLKLSITKTAMKTENQHGIIIKNFIPKLSKPVKHSAQLRGREPKPPACLA